MDEDEGCPIYSPIDSVGVTNRLHWRLAYRTRNININYSTLLLGLKANLFCTNTAIGMTSFCIGIISIKRTFGTNGPSELTNRICFCNIGHN